MTIKLLLKYCLEKDGAYIDHPFGIEYPVVKIKSSSGKSARIFAEFYNLDGRDIMTFSTDEDTAVSLRMEFPSIVVRGWHCPPVQAKYKSSVYIADMSNDLLMWFVDMSYNRAVSKLK